MVSIKITLVLVLVIVSSVIGTQNGQHAEILSRKKRNAFQLAILVDYYTPYTWNQLLSHGNWCGLGNRAPDGASFTDACDLCCKKHDACYWNLLYKTRETYADTFIGLGNNLNLNLNNNFGLGGSSRNRRLSEPDLTSRKCLPYADSYNLHRGGRGGSQPACDGTGSLCSREACRCDVQFVNCLKYTSCKTGSASGNGNGNASNNINRRSRRY